MVQCEMCGAETSSPTTIKVEGAELDVCDNCSSFGTEVRDQQSSGSTSTKYSTGSSSGSRSGQSKSNRSSGGSSGGGRRHDMFDEMGELAQDYDDRIRDAREERGLSQSELANELNEKASLIRKLEHGDMLPSDRVQKKLERFLDISLSEGTTTDESEWSGGSSTGTMTLGDVVKRKD